MSTAKAVQPLAPHEAGRNGVRPPGGGRPGTGRAGAVRAGRAAAPAASGGPAAGRPRGTGAPASGVTPADFTVVVGGDLAGKSSALAELAAQEPSVRVLSTDEQFLGPQHGQVAQLRKLAGRVLPRLGTDYTPDFLAALFHAGIVHLHDELRRCPPGGTVVMDSYYYKFLAKCRLAGVADGPLFAHWRALPQPRRVVELAVPAEVAWERSGHGAALNSLEYHGPRPTRAGFERYQRDLRTLLHQEVAHLPVVTVRQGDCPAETAQFIKEAVTDVLV